GKRPVARHRQIAYVKDIVSKFTVDEFKTFFRFSRISVQYLLESITEICISENISGILCRHSSGGSEQIPLHNRILILIWYMASLDKYSSIADRFGVSESTASCAIRNLLQFIQENLVKKVIIWPTGDSAYPNLPWLLVPFRDNGHLTYAQKTFNKTHSSIRSNVERAFGQLKGRFTRLQSVNQRDIRTIVQTILTGCVLHNICIINHDDMDDMLNCD
ncbi:hypothetical protein KUTeg_018690, partial [Tegillarca granosa]